MRASILFTAAVTAAALVTNPAHAEPESTTAAPAVETEPHWYGGRILVADALALGLGYAAVQGTDSESMMLLALGSFVVTPAVMHLQHGRPARALASAGLRLGLPLAVGSTFAGLSTCGSDEWFCGVGEFVGGFMLGSVAAMVVDQFLARDTHPVRLEKRSLVLLPTVMPAKGGATAGLVGIF